MHLFEISIALAAMTALANAQSAENPLNSFDYSDHGKVWETNPDWQCNGVLQSPININTSLAEFNNDMSIEMEDFGKAYNINRL